MFCLFITENTGKLDVVFVLDSSTSVGRDDFAKMLQFCKHFLKLANIYSGDERVGMLTYSTKVTVEFQLKDFSTQEEIFYAIDQVPWRHGATNTADAVPWRHGATNTADALKTMSEEMFTSANGDRPDAKNIAMVITVGVSNINSRWTVPEAYNAQDKGIHIYAIGINLTDAREVNAIASRPAENNAFLITFFDELDGLAKLILHSIRPGMLFPLFSQALTRGVFFCYLQFIANFYKSNWFIDTV